MSRLCYFESVIEDSFKSFKIKVPEGFDFTIPSDTVKFECEFNDSVSFCYVIDYYRFKRKDYVYVSLFVGPRMYFGLFDRVDEKLIYHLIQKFIRANINF